MNKFKGWNHPLCVIPPTDKEFKEANPLSSDTISEAIKHVTDGDKIYVASAFEYKEMLIIGKYTITRYRDNDYWIEEEGGEGMQVFEKNFIDLINKFYEEEF